MTVAVRYIVDDTDAAADWYVAQLGFEVEMRPAPGFALLTRGDLRLMLNAPGAGGAGQAGDPAPGGWNRFQLTTDDLDADVDRLRTAGVRLRTDVIEGRGGRQVLIDDPSGNAVELFQPTAR